LHRLAGDPVLSSLKSLLETGAPLEETRHWPKEVPSFGCLMHA
jgi:hypothetical protein